MPRYAAILFLIALTAALLALGGAAVAKILLIIFVTLAALGIIAGLQRPFLE